RSAHGIQAGAPPIPVSSSSTDSSSSRKLPNSVRAEVPSRITETAQRTERRGVAADRSVAVVISSSEVSGHRGREPSRGQGSVRSGEERVPAFDVESVVHGVAEPVRDLAAEVVVEELLARPVRDGERIADEPDPEG